jgi:hypothetical protein
MMQRLTLENVPLCIGSRFDTDKRSLTPSTVADEHEADFRNVSTHSLSDLSTPCQKAFHHIRGLSGDQFRAAVREPFRFPIQRQASVGTAICIVCNSLILGGDTCRELRACGHCFHANCIEEHFKDHSRCPVCRSKCRPSSSKLPKKRNKSKRPLWTPEYDEELLSLSDRLDRERRQKLFLVKGKRDSTPQSYVFLKSTLPMLIEEPVEEVLSKDEGTVVSLCRYIYREIELRKLCKLDEWTSDMKRLGITFVYSLMGIYAYQIMFVDLFLKRQFRFSNTTDSYSVLRDQEPKL